MSNGESLRAQGTALAEEGCFEKAIDFFESATELDKREPIAFELLAQCLMAVNRDDDAYVAASRAVELDPDWSEGHLTLARAARNSGCLQGSITAFQSCIDKGGDASVRDELQEVESLCMARISSRVGLPHLKIKQNFGDGSGPGCVVWTCGLFLAWYLANRVSGELKGKRVLELGSGTGIGAIAAALLGSHVLATDLTDALPLLSQNIDLNIGTITNNGGTCHSSELDWFSPPGFKAKPFCGFDLVLGADLVYSESQIEGLCATLGNLVASGESRMEFLLVQKTRDVCIDRKLFDGCRKSGVHFTEVTMDTTDCGCKHELHSIHLYRGVSSKNVPSSNPV